MGREAALAWVNAKNSSFDFGRFYVAISADTRLGSSVVYEDTIYRSILDEAPQLLKGYVQQLLKLTIDVAGGEPHGFISSVGGSPFEDTDHDRGALAMAAMG